MNKPVQPYNIFGIKINRGRVARMKHRIEEFLDSATTPRGIAYIVFLFLVIYTIALFKYIFGIGTC